MFARIVEPGYGGGATPQGDCVGGLIPAPGKCIGFGGLPLGTPEPPEPEPLG